jgi:predicted DNA-binding ribbon-helix-helix protein
MQSAVLKRSVVVAGHKTSVSLEDAFWNGLKEIGGERRMTLSDLIAAIDAQRQHGNLSSAIRLFVLDLPPIRRVSILDTHAQARAVRAWRAIQAESHGGTGCRQYVSGQQPGR